MDALNASIHGVSTTFSASTLEKIITDARPFTDQGHFLYPADANGNHTEGFFAIEPVARWPAFVDAIAEDVAIWADRESIDVDVIFAPAQPAVRVIADAVGKRLRKPTAYWEYFPSGRFGDRLVEGEVVPGTKVLALNGVSLQGRCVGLRLPQFVERLGGNVVAAAVFAKGVADFVRTTEARFGRRFYSTIQVDVPVYAPSECPLCAAGEPLPISWREFADGRCQ